MKVRFIRSVYMRPADDGAEGGGGGDPTKVGDGQLIDDPSKQPDAAAQAAAAAAAEAAKGGAPKAGQIVAVDADGKVTYTDAPGAPEKYEAFTVPDGMVLDEALLTEFTPTLKELKLSQADAQKLMDFAPKLVQKTTERAVQQTVTDLFDRLGLKDHDKWAAQAKTDKEIGGDKFDENMSLVRKAMDAFGSPQLHEALKKVGLGNHPEVLRFFYRAGKAISADRFVPGGRTNTVEGAATRIYDKSNMNP